MSKDPVLDELLKLQASLDKTADANGYGLKDRRKSEFKNAKQILTFIAAYGQDAYNNLRD